MPVYTLDELIAVNAAETIYDSSIAVADVLGLPVTSWLAGDPTRSQYWALATELEKFEDVVAGYVASGFLDLSVERCNDDPDNAERYAWLVTLADQVYGYTADAATYASTTVTLTNGGGGLFVIAAGDLTFKSSITDKTYTNTTGGTLASGPGTTLDVTVIADEPGSASTAAAGQIDTLVTTLLNVTCTNAAAATGTDAETPASIAAGCRAKLGSLSPSGPADAYDYVATNAALTGTTEVTRSRTYDDSTTGDVTIYVAGPAGAVGAGVVTSVEEAIVEWATPLCITPTVTSAADNAQDVTYELWLYESVNMTTGEVEAAVEDALEALFVERPIGGDIKAAVGSGFLYHSMLRGAFRETFGAHFVDVAVTLPAADVAIAANEVPVLGTVTVTDIHFEAAP
jgi:hypothetical protein